MKKTVFPLVLLIFFSPVFAQNMNTLKKQQKQSKDKIELTNKLLKETQADRKSTVSNLSLLKKQISEREKLISLINAEIGELDTQEIRLDSMQTELEMRLENLKAGYARLIYHAYFLNKQYSKYFFIFSSESLTQAYRRLRYVQQYSEYRKQQAAEIQQVSTELEAMKNKIAQTKGEKQVALKSKEVENSRLQNSRNNTEKMLTELSKKEKDLAKQLAAEQKKAAELNKKINDLIAKEIAEQERKARAKAEADRKKAAAANQTKPTTSAKPAATTPVTTLTQEESLIAGNFERNKGRLPSPVKGVITGHFGIQKHPVHKIDINNKGIYIQTLPNTDALAVFDGEVTQVFAIPGGNNSVIVKHGNFRTVYNNLTTTYVKVGTKVTAKQKIGKVYVDSENDNKSELYFMIYKGATLENPELWLSK